MRAARAKSGTISELQCSNLTTNAFIGSTPKSWMTGQSTASTRDTSSPKASASKADQAPSSRRTKSASEAPEAANNNDSPSFGADSDRGRYPAQRPRQGGIEKCATLEENPGSTKATPMPVITTAESILPSPSPSVDACQNSVNVVENEDERPQPQAAGVQPTGGPKATLEELMTMCGGIDQFEKLLKDAGKSIHGQSPIATSEVASERLVASPSKGSLPQGQPSGSMNKTTPEPVHGILSPSVANKRPQAITDEPRKRLQSLPSASSGDTFTIPLVTSLLPNKNGQVSEAASPSGPNEIMIQSLRTLDQRMQLVTNSPRKGSHVEKPRLLLLCEACEKSDYFYLVLHELFCFEHGARKSNRQLPGLNKKHQKGLDVVTFLLVSNEEMAENAVTWFSLFPLPLGDLLNSPQFTSAHAKVLRCLEKMASFWADMRSQCTRRMYPPLVDELVIHLCVESFVFLQIIFRALLRDVWSGNPDKCFQIAEEVFKKDYKDAMSRFSKRGIPVESVKHDRHAVIKDYQRILESHRQHSSVGSTASMAPPRQQSRLATANDNLNNRNTSQSEHNSRILPSLAPHEARAHSLSAASGPAPVATQATQVCRQGSLQNQSQSLASNAFPSPQIGDYVQSPTTLQGFPSWSNSSMTSLEQWNGQQHPRGRRASGPAAASLGAVNTLNQNPYSTAPAQRTPNVRPFNVSEASNMHQLQQNLGLQQHSHNRRPSLNSANPRPNAQLEVRRSLSNRAGEASLPTPSSYPSILAAPSLPPPANPAQLIRSYPPLPNHPNATVSALHQAHLRSPTLSYVSPNENPSSMVKCYSFIKHVLTPPEELASNNRHVSWDFSVSRELIDWFARDIPNVYGAPPTRAIVSGSRLCRIRCISLKNKAGMPNQNEWAVADNVWPSSTAVVLNGIALDIRRKTHHGKDLPIDVTSYIKEGRNNLSTAVIGFQKDSTSRFVIGVELVQVIDEQGIKREIKMLPPLEARKRILDQSKDLDPDIEVTQSQRVLDLTDPFTARIFEVPVRGIYCHHNQCFDRDTFLQTRSAKLSSEPCSPDEFRCPICGKDARPPSLMMDMFFAEVRAALKGKDRLDVKAIVLQDSGEWEIKEEEETTGESGDGTGRKRAGIVSGASTANALMTRQNTPRDVIELD